MLHLACWLIHKVAARLRGPGWHRTASASGRRTATLRAALRAGRAHRAATFVYAAVLSGAASYWTLSVEGVVLHTSAPDTASAISRAIATRDDTPARSLLVPRRGLIAGSEVVSNTIRLSGITVPVGLAIQGDGQMSVAGGPFTRGPSVAERGQPIVLRAVAPEPGTTTTVTLIHGTTRTDWSLTSLEAPAHTHQTLYGPWGACSADQPCDGIGSQSRDILCLRSDGRFVAVTACAAELTAVQTRTCPSPAGTTACPGPPPGTSGWTQYCPAGSAIGGACTGSTCQPAFAFDGASCVQQVFAGCAADSAGDGGWSHAALPHGGIGIRATRPTPGIALPAFATAATDEAPVTCSDGLASLGMVVTRASACLDSHTVIDGACVAKAACAADSAGDGWRHAALDHGREGPASRDTPPLLMPPGAASARDTTLVTCDDGRAVASAIATMVLSCQRDHELDGAGGCRPARGGGLIAWSAGSGSVPENGAGQSAGTLVTDDPDTAPGDLVYTLVGGAGDTDNGRVSLSGATVIVTGPHDHETTPALAIRVEATDGVNRWQQALTIAITDLNEPPVITVTALPPVAENAPPGTAVATVAISDPDRGQSLTTRVDGPHGGLFAVQGTALVTQTGLDADQTPALAVDVVVSDGSLEVTGTVLIAVLDLDDEIVQFPGYLAWEGHSFARDCRGYLDAWDTAAGTGDDPVRRGRPGNDPAHTGLYRIDPDQAGGAAAFDVWCEMSVDGGGWTQAAYHSGVHPTYLKGTYQAWNTTAPATPTAGIARAIDTEALGLAHNQILFWTDDPAWHAPGQRDYRGFWIGNSGTSAYNLKSNSCQLLQRTSAHQWDGQLVYFAGDGANDDGCTGGGSVFAGIHTCDDGGGGVTTNTLWPTNGTLDELWGYNCVVWGHSQTGFAAETAVFQKAALPATGAYHLYVRSAPGFNHAPATPTVAQQAVAENAPAGTLVATLSASDLDGHALTFTVAGPDAASFAIASGNRLVTAAPLDAERGSVYQIDVVATDSGTPPQSSRRRITVAPTNTLDQIVSFGSHMGWEDGALARSCRGYLEGSDNVTATADDPARSGRPGTDAGHNGLYRIDPDGGSASNARTVWCEMSVAGGGWTQVAYHWESRPSYLFGTYSAYNWAAPVAPSRGQARAIDPNVLGIAYTSILFYTDDTAWFSTNPARDYRGYWIGNHPSSTYNLKSNTCQVLNRTSGSQWNGSLVYFGGNGLNDDGCIGGGSFFTSRHSCDDGGGGVTTNNNWPTSNVHDSLWNWNCIVWAYGNSPTTNANLYKNSPILGTGQYHFYVR